MNAEIVSLVALLVALTSTVINYLMLRGQIDPEVLVYAIPDDNRPTIINLVIENVGKGVADNVSFKSNLEIPERAFGLKNLPEPKKMQSGPLINGISSMVSGEKRIITWGQYEGLQKGLHGSVIEIETSYYSKPLLSMKRKRHKTISIIDINSYEGTDASDSNWARQSVKQLEKIAKCAEKLVARTPQPKERSNEDI